MLRKNDNVSIEQNTMWDTLDPNDPDDFVKVSTAEDVRKHYKNTKKIHLKVQKKCVLKTGRRPGYTASHCDFEYRDLEHFLVTTISRVQF